MALDGAITLRSVATKKLAPAQHRAFVKAFTDWVNEKHEGNQTYAGKAIGITQSHVSALLKGERGPGLPLLIRLRKPLNLSIDEILGLEPLATDEAQTMRRLAQGVREIIRKEAESTTVIEAELLPPGPDPDTERAVSLRRRQRS